MTHLVTSLTQSHIESSAGKGSEYLKMARRLPVLALNEVFIGEQDPSEYVTIIILYNIIVGNFAE